MKNFGLTSSIIALSSAVLLSGCNEDTKYRYIQADDSSSPVNMAVISVAGPSDASLEYVNLNNNVLTATRSNIATGATDYSISAYGKYFYHIGKYQIDTITKYSLDNPTSSIWSFSTLDNSDAVTSNPYELVFVNDSKAYLIRYGSDKLWIVNPSATNQKNFKIGEIDLSAYSDADGIPEMAAGIVIDDKFYLALQRQENWAVIQGYSYVAVFNTTTDEEIDTRASGSTATLKGIQLQTANPIKFDYHKDVGLLVQAIGDYGTQKIGGLERIDLTDYSTTVLIDENTDGYKVDNIQIINKDKAYFSTYEGWDLTTFASISNLCSFNPAASDIIASIDCNISDLQSKPISGLTKDYLDRLWVSLYDIGNPRVELINTDDDSLETTISTVYAPEKVVITEPVERFEFK